MKRNESKVIRTLYEFVRMYSQVITSTIVFASSLIYRESKNDSALELAVISHLSRSDQLMFVPKQV